MEKTVVTRTLNGVAVDKLYETIEQIKATPHLGSFKFRSRNRWVEGGRNQSTILNIYGAGEEQPARSEPFVLDADEPALLLGTDAAPNPVEFLLHALTACVTTSLVYHAAAKGIRIESVESRTEGDIDLRGFLGIDPTVPRGFQDIRITFKIKADVPDEQLEELCRLGPTFSPVHDTVTRAVNVSVNLDRTA